MWGFSSSVDPASEGLTAARINKDVARCTATVGDPDSGILNVEVANAYPGYVCSIAATFTNGTTVAVLVEPAVISSDIGLIVTEITDSPIPSSIEPDESATAVFAVRVEQTAPEGTVMSLTISIAMVGEDL